MPSLRSKLLNFTTRQLMRVIFRHEKPVPEFRPVFAKLDKKRPLASGVTMEDVDAPIAGRWLRNESANASATRQVILYLHGGAFSMRLPNGHSAFVSHICSRTDASAFMAYYRLAPENPFPAAPNDCLAAYQWLLSLGHEPRDIVVMGDSAGGNLTLSLLHMIKAAALPMPSGVIALSPITDAAQISATWRQNKILDPMYVVQGAVNPARWYFAGHNPMNPLISPYYGDYTGFPPLYFLVGGVEALLEDSVGMVRKAVESGIPAKVQVWKGMPHVFPLVNFLPESGVALAEIAKWLGELRIPRDVVDPKILYKSCVEYCNLSPVTHSVTRETNDVYFQY